jgi:dihydrofolate reductase
MKLVTNTQITLDGVVQGNGGRNENRSGGFERGGWAMALTDPEGRAFVAEYYLRADAFLFGRRTYDLFARSWGVMEAGSNPVADSLNTKSKYVVSNTLTDPQWANTTVLNGDVAAAIRELKTKSGGELQVHGSGTLVQWLLENGLVDEMTLIVYPVVLGQGMRLFPDHGPDIAFDLVESRTFPKGKTVQVYRPNGKPEYITG